MTPRQLRDSEEYDKMTCKVCGSGFLWRKDAPFKSQWCKICFRGAVERGEIELPDDDA